MTIGFDVSDLGTNRADGTTRYTWELAKRFPRMDGSHTWLYFTPLDSALIRELASDIPTVRIVASVWPRWWTQTRLPADLYRHRPDVLFMPIQQIPYLRPGNMKTVAVMHDLAVHRYPQQFTYKDWLLLHIFSSYVARKADHIIAVSNATACDIAHYYGRVHNVHVVHHGVDHTMFRLPRGEEKNTSWHKLTMTYPTLQRPYLLYVGQIQPRKNLARFVEAFERLIRILPDMHLVLAGSHGWLQQQILERIDRSPCKDRIIMTGRVSDELLVALYWHAELFVLPSLYEGFGMPVLEAMACGCPVVTSSVSSLPETAGHAAVLINPHDTDSLVSGILDASQQRAVLIERGLSHAKRFTWDTVAQQTLQVLERASL